jgi:hypothetical protein
MNDRKKKNIDTQSWVTLQGEEWIIQSTPRPFGRACAAKGQRQK